MDKQIKTELCLSNSEFIMISLMLGAQKIVGITDVDTIGQMNEVELGAKWDEIKKSLIAKGYIQEVMDDGMNIEETIFLNINLYSTANKLFELHITKQEDSTISELFFVSDVGIANITIDHKNEGELKIKPPITKNQLVEILKSHISLPDVKKVESFDEGEALLSKGQYYQFMANVNLDDQEKAIELLMNGGMNDHFAKDAIKGFINKERFLTFSFHELKDKKTAQEIFMFYSSQMSYFGIDVSDEEDIVFSIKALSDEDCRGNIENFIFEKTKVMI